MFRHLFRLRHQPVAPRPRYKPTLEVLEDRLTPSAAAATAPPDSVPVQNLPLLQPLLSLAIDGAALQTQSIFYKYVVDIDEFPLGSSLDASRANAAAAGINFDTVTALIELNGFGRTPDEILSDIRANAASAGVFTPLALRAGADAVLQAVQLPVQPQTGEHRGDHH